MKIIPKDELIALLENGERNMIDMTYISHLFDNFGDDYFIDRDTSEYRLYLKSVARERFMEGKNE